MDQVLVEVLIDCSDADLQVRRRDQLNIRGLPRGQPAVEVD